MTCSNLRSENTRLEQHSSAAAAAASGGQLSGKEEENKQLKSEIVRLMTDLQNLTQVGGGENNRKKIFFKRKKSYLNTCK
jgi:hypothetical protein